MRRACWRSWRSPGTTAPRSTPPTRWNEWSAIKRRTDVVGIFPKEEAVTRLLGAILNEQNDE
ncbi:hypothetical protein GXW74_10480 [Roseomonas eburnea]|uniref:Transposase n=1 Tax=Neoroseomonas eburnea TaxID=1346889 RepID=A0A9X9XB29_9PROT|nr:hypothetical protein [Neoroseomonas eburnea]